MAEPVSSLTTSEEPSASFFGLGPEPLAALADGFELLSLSFSFPSQSLARALVDGSFREDLEACLKELGVSDAPDLEIGDDPAELLNAMRREYSRLYHSPGKLAVIYPYESAFLFVRRGKGSPTLLANRITGEVEAAMARAGCLPKTACREAVDSVWQECDAMRHMLTQALACLLAPVEEGTVRADWWLARAEAFFNEHIASWVPAFMDATMEQARLPVYRSLAEIGNRFLRSSSVV